MQFQIERSVEILSRTPATLNSLLRGLSSDWIYNNEGGDSWSPFDIVGHLIHGEETDWIPRARIILEHGQSRPFEPFERFAMLEKSKGKSLDELLDTFARLRKESLVALKKLELSPKKLEQTGIHPALGQVTLRQLLSTWTVHDLNHIGQIVRVMAKQYKEEVGPWISHLSILNKPA